MKHELNKKINKVLSSFSNNDKICYVVLSVKQGLSVNKMATHLGLSRQAIYDILEGIYKELKSTIPEIQRIINDTTVLVKLDEKISEENRTIITNLILKDRKDLLALSNENGHYLVKKEFNPNSGIGRAAFGAVLENSFLFSDLPMTIKAFYQKIKENYDTDITLEEFELLRKELYGDRLCCIDGYILTVKTFIKSVLLNYLKISKEKVFSEEVFLEKLHGSCKTLAKNFKDVKALRKYINDRSDIKDVISKFDRRNETKKPDGLVASCELLAQGLKYNTADTKYINKKLSLEMDAMELKRILVESGKFIRSNKTIVILKERANEHTHSLEDLMVEVIEREGEMDAKKLRSELFELGRDYAKENIYLAIKNSNKVMLEDGVCKLSK